MISMTERSGPAEVVRTAVVATGVGTGDTTVPDRADDAMALEVGRADAFGVAGALVPGALVAAGVRVGVAAVESGVATAQSGAVIAISGSWTSAV